MYSIYPTYYRIYIYCVHLHNLKTEAACITRVNHSECLKAKKKGNTTMRTEYKFVSRPPRDNPLNAPQTLRVSQPGQKKCL